MPTHGEATTYWQGCRCDECKAAYNAQHKAYKVRRSQREDEIPHGTARGYLNWLCRCDACREASKIAKERTTARRYLARFGIDLDDVVRQDA